ncbi:hypothetical protein J2Y41_003913 [Arthrobacter sp. 1088]|nr:hypothetical protein [Arthrobacter sp. 1088]
MYSSCIFVEAVRSPVLALISRAETAFGSIPVTGAISRGLPPEYFGVPEHCPPPFRKGANRGCDRFMLDHEQRPLPGPVYHAGVQMLIRRGLFTVSFFHNVMATDPIEALR